MNNGCLQGWWKSKLLGVLMIAGLLASSAEYTFAQQSQCGRPGKPPCPETLRNYQQPPNPPAKEIFQNLLRRYPKEILQLQRDDPQTIQKLWQRDPTTLQKLEQLAPNSTLQLQQQRLTPHLRQ